MNTFSKVYVEATVAKTTFYKKKEARLDFLYNYLQIAFVSVAYNLCISLLRYALFWESIKIKPNKRLHNFKVGVYYVVLYAI